MNRRFVVAVWFLASWALSACGSGGDTAHGPSSTPTGLSASAQVTGVAQVHRRSTAVRPSFPRLLGAATSSSPTSFTPAVKWRGRVAAWIARRAGVSVLSFDQHLVTLRLHSGTLDAGTAGWRWGPEISRSEQRLVVAAFNGGFRLNTASGGFVSYGRVAVPLADGLGSIVTYSDGDTEIGAWRQGVPALGRRVVSVRQNLRLLIDQGRPAASIDCLTCWGATLGGVAAPARSALGITADRRLIWAGGEDLTVSALADALLGARVVRAVELDINPEWVAGYLYAHHGAKRPPVPAQVVAGQPGVPGQFLEPYSRDFFTVSARPSSQ